MNKSVLSNSVLCLSCFIAISSAANWPSWRGPAHNGMATGDAPLQWSDSENVKWKVPMPGRGNSSPVIWGDKIFLTTAIQIGETPPPAPRPEADKPRPRGQGRPPAGPQGRRPRRQSSGPQAEHKFVVMALDRTTGKVIWEQTATTATPHEGHHRTYGSFASPSPLADGERLWAFFGSQGLYCYDFDGKLIWEKDLGQFRMWDAYGEGVAPALYGDKLILKLDHEGVSFLVVLNKITGEELWRQARDEVTSWSEPLVIEHGSRTQIVVSASSRVRGYDLESGDLIWECGGLGSNVIPTPVYHDGMVFVMSGYRDPNLLAIKLGGTGDLTGTDAVVWSQDRGTSYTVSPVLHDGKLYVLSDRGLISCFDAKTGEPYYQQQRLPGPYNFKASLVAANGKLYLASENEDVLVVKMGEEFEVLATNKLTDEMFVATPAIADGEIFLRSQKNLFCIGGKN